eukprot:1266996-Rhodomonas_salina.5
MAKPRTCNRIAIRRGNSRGSRELRVVAPNLSLWGDVFCVVGMRAQTSSPVAKYHAEPARLDVRQRRGSGIAHGHDAVTFRFQRGQLSMAVMMIDSKDSQMLGQDMAVY